MDGTDVILFGIALILFGGFVMVGYAAGFDTSPYDSAGYFVAIAGLGVSLLGLVVARDG